MESFSYNSINEELSKSGPFLIILKISCVLSGLTNIVFLFFYARRMFEKKNSFIFILFFTFGFFETIISILWLLLFFLDYYNKYMSLIFIFSIYYNTFFILCINDRLGLTVLNIANVNSKKYIYFIISLVIGLFVSVISSSFELYDKYNKNIIIILYFRTFRSGEKSYIYFFLIFFYILPIIALIIFFFQRIKIKGAILYKYDNENRIFYDSYSNKFLFYLFSHFLISILYLLSIKFNIDIIIKNIVLYILIINPLFELIIKIKKLEISNCFSKNHMDADKSYYLNKSFRASHSNDNYFELSDNEKIEKLENKNIIHLTKDIYIAICYCLEKQIKTKKNSNVFNLQEKINNELSRENKVYTINRSTIASENSELSKDEKILKEERFSIECVEYAPKIFSILRELDNIKEEEIFYSMLPMNNHSSFSKSDGKGGALFLNTFDKKFIIKTIIYEEFEFMRNKLLTKIVEYFKDNKDSLITRIYGIYKIKMYGSYNDQYFLLMKNNFGVFKKKVLSKYDLKGSKYTREVQEEGKDIVFKDINFDNKEGALILNDENRNKLLKIVSKDAKFLNELEIMDYSLLVVKLKLNDDELTNLFDINFKKNNKLELAVIIAELKEGKQDIKLDTLFREEYDPNAVNFIKKDTENLKKFIFPSLYDNEVYLISIIDYLQLFTLKKKLELQYKKFKAEENEISSVDPNKYKNRFIEYVKKITDENAIRNKIKEKFNI